MINICSKLGKMTVLLLLASCSGRETEHLSKNDRQNIDSANICKWENVGTHSIPEIMQSLRLETIDHIYFDPVENDDEILIIANNRRVAFFHMDYHYFDKTLSSLKDGSGTARYSVESAKDHTTDKNYRDRAYENIPWEVSEFSNSSYIGNQEFLEIRFNEPVTIPSESGRSSFLYFAIASHQYWAAETLSEIDCEGNITPLPIPVT